MPRRDSAARDVQLHRRIALVLVLVLAGCRTGAPLPLVPEVATGGFLPAVRQAVDSARQEAKAHPESASAAGRLGMVLHAHQQVTTAKLCYQRAALLDTKNFDWHYYLGVTSEGAGAIEELRAALRIRDYLPARLKLGEALLASGDNAGARAIYSGLDHPAALFGYGRATNDAAYYEKALAAFPQFGAAIFALAQHYQRSGRAADAQKLMAEYPRYKTSAPPVDDPLMDAVRALDKSPAPLLEEASRLEARGDLAGAAGLQLRALELDPKLAQARVNLISLYGRMGDPAKAEQYYREAVTQNPSAHEAYYNFGVLCYQARRRGEAHAAFERALALDPAYADAHNNLGAMLEEEGKLAEASEHFRRAIESRPAFALARFHLGRIYANQGRYSEAIEQLQRAAAEAEPDNRPTYLYALGAAQARSGNSAGARSSLASAREAALARGQAALAATIERDLGRLRP